MATFNIVANKHPITDKISGKQYQTRTITGVGFGSGPTLAFFDRLDIPLDWRFYNATPKIGAWSSGTDYQYMQHAERAWIPLRDPENITSSSANKGFGKFTIGTDVGELFIAYRMTADPALIFPGALGPNQPLTLSSSLPYKPLWLSDDGNTNTPDQVLPNFNASGWGVFGNTCSPKSYIPDLYSVNWPGSSRFDTSGASTLWGFYQGPDNGTASNFEYLRVDSETSTIQSHIGDLYHPNGATPTKRFYDGNVHINAQLTMPSTGYVNLQTGQTDFYCAVGPNCRASVWTSNSPVWSTQTEAYIIDADVWSDTEIKFSPHPREAALGYYHVRLGDGSIRQNVTVV